MSYSTYKLDTQIKVYNLAAASVGTYGREQGGYDMQHPTTLWASVDWQRGVRGLREGSVDNYDVLLIRTRYSSALVRKSRIEYDGDLYAIESYHADKSANTIQITARELTALG